MTIRFEFPPDLRFTCSRCGDCCRGWDVPLGPGERQRLEALDWSERAPELVGVKPGVRLRGTSGSKHHRLARRRVGRDETTGTPGGRHEKCEINRTTHHAMRNPRRADYRLLRPGGALRRRHRQHCASVLSVRGDDRCLNESWPIFVQDLHQLPPNKFANLEAIHRGPFVLVLYRNFDLSECPLRLAL